VARREVSSEVIAMSMPALLRAELTEGAIESQHRSATVGFVKVSGIPGITASGPNAVADALDEVVSTAQESTEAEAVTFLASDIDEGGFKIILATGVPTSGADDEGRMLRALRRIVDAPLPLPLRAGVNRGHVYAGEIGTSHRSAYTVMGDTVNLASRLEGLNKAYGTSVLVAEPTYRAAQSRVVARPVDWVQVKGKQVGVQVFELLCLADEEDRGARELAALSEEAFAAYRARDFRGALAHFARVRLLRPDDRVAALFEERCRTYLTAPPPDDWDGVSVAAEK
jgi:class 3 adenylate cyclase